MNADSFTPAAMSPDRRQLRWLTRLAIATIAVLAGILHAGASDANAAFMANTSTEIYGIDGIRGAVKLSNQCGVYGDHCWGHQMVQFGCSYVTRQGILARNQSGPFHPTGGWYYYGDACNGTVRGSRGKSTVSVIQYSYCVSDHCWRSRP